MYPRHSDGSVTVMIRASKERNGTITLHSDRNQCYCSKGILASNGAFRAVSNGHGRKIIGPERASRVVSRGGLVFASKVPCNRRYTFNCTSNTSLARELVSGCHRARRTCQEGKELLTEGRVLTRIRRRPKDCIPSLTRLTRLCRRQRLKRAINYRPVQKRCLAIDRDSSGAFCLVSVRGNVIAKALSGRCTDLQLQLFCLF